MRGTAVKGFLYRLSQRLTQTRYWLTAQVAKALLSLLRRLPMDTALDFADRTARRLGPLVGRHKVALDNLRHAYPEKSEDEIKAIALDMWGNMARLAAEYIFLDAIFDYDPHAEKPGRVEVSGERLFDKIAAEDKPHIIFTGHLGNFELLPIAGATFGMKVTALFRPPNNPYIADYIFSTRRAMMGDLLASRRGASFALARILDNNGTIGVLVDQKFTNGMPTTFFGRACETSPLLPKLVRQYECDVYPARCIRLPGNRYRLEIEDKLELTRDTDGSVDLQATAQLLNDVVERWVRENPGQWMWFHKRWMLSNGRRRRARRKAPAQA
ncbi:lipid A biosynthesis lauroyl acyltransferase [Mesorhizobium sp. KR1-2]|uniref:lipid A biosynthesis lauroyl acyltransferase n=1 Tax=Mesorhizobium sp. KR1-2 TaxID=3156609 RepID=UPI0032B58115